MAGFHSNTCTYADCGRNYSNLPDLIHHIEEEHVDFDPVTMAAMENSNPMYVPMSYVLKFSSFSPREKQFPHETDPVKYEDQVSFEDDSKMEVYSPDVINSKNSLDPNFQRKKDSYRLKRFACPIPGCNKRYKNINGIKYHARNGHDGKKSPVKTRKTHKCQCGKSYKTIHGLDAHTSVHNDFHRNPISHPQMFSPQLSYMMNKSYVNTEMINGNNPVVKNEVFEETILSYSYLEQVPKLSDTIDVENNNTFGLIPPSSGHTGFSFNENFAENFSIEDHRF